MFMKFVIDKLSAIMLYLEVARKWFRTLGSSKTLLSTRLCFNGDGLQKRVTMYKSMIPV